MFKNERGITLVSLVITIIVLLILATVAITLAVNTDGIFPRAEEARNQWNNKVVEEGTFINNSMDYLYNYVPNSLIGFSD